MKENQLIIEEFITKEFSKENLNSPLSESISYVMLSSGKRIRPLLTLTIATDCGVNPEKLVRAAVALETIHAASLIHDDLPALDNDDLRRGVPSCHKQFGEATAILTADYLFGHAFYLINSAEELSPQTRGIMSLDLADALKKLCDGQELDLKDKEDKRKNLCKTGALFATSAAFAGIFCFPSEDRKVLELKKFGERAGLLFQLVDDIQDGDIKEYKFLLDQSLKELYRQKADTEISIGYELKKTGKLLETIYSKLESEDPPF